MSTSSVAAAATRVAMTLAALIFSPPTLFAQTQYYGSSTPPASAFARPSQLAAMRAPPPEMRQPSFPAKGVCTGWNWFYPVSIDLSTRLITAGAGEPNLRGAPPQYVYMVVDAAGIGSATLPKTGNTYTDIRPDGNRLHIRYTRGYNNGHQAYAFGDNNEFWLHCSGG